MELHILCEAGTLRTEINIANLNSPTFKKSFGAAQPPILVEERSTYTGACEIEGRIFHLAQECDVALFEKDEVVQRNIQSLYRNFMLFLRGKTDYDKQKHAPNASLPPQVVSSRRSIEELLGNLDKVLEQRRTRYLLSNYTTQYDCELMPRLHHIRIVGRRLLNFDIPHELVYLWKYIETSYQTPAFVESCPADQDIIQHYKEQLKLLTSDRVTLQAPTMTFEIPDDVQNELMRLEN